MILDLSLPGYKWRRGDTPAAGMDARYKDAIGSSRVYVTNLRKKLEADPSEPRLIVTEPGVGHPLKLD